MKNSFPQGRTARVFLVFYNEVWLSLPARRKHGLGLGGELAFVHLIV